MPAATAPVPASTVVLARQGDPLQVFLVRRPDSAAFMSGAHVFPGGRIDDGDYIADSDADRCCEGVGAAIARMAARPAAEAIAFHVAAVRELFEEAGVLLAREAGAAPPAGWRRDLLENRITMPGLARREGLLLALDALTLFAHWVTPDIETRRFDTCFFFAVAPDAQVAAHDDREHTHGEWISPSAAIGRCRAGEMALPPPTWTTLRALSRFASVEEAQAWARAQSAPRVQPRVVRRDDGTHVVMLPGDPSCPAVDGFETEETRFLLEHGRWSPVQPD